MNQSIRIIGGRFRGKKLHVPLMDGLRPTPDRIRETVFNWLMPLIHDAHCLDAFAGSGALGFEAFSRGAAEVVLVERAPGAYLNLVKQAQTFHSTQLIVLKDRASDYFKKTRKQFNIIFLDPPFSENLLPDCLAQLAALPVLIPGGLVYIEAPEAIVMEPTRWIPLKEKRSGHITYGLYKKIP